MKSASFLLLFLLFGIQQHSHSPNVFEEPHNATSDNLPEWVSLMYSPNADYEEVRLAKQAYYRQHPFVKNSYTQYFKRWSRAISRDMDGSLHGKQDRKKVREEQQQFIARSKQLRQQRGPNSAWQGIGPFDFDKLANSSSYAAGAAHIYTIERATTDVNRLYAGTATGGLWRTDDNGANWYLITKDEMINSIVSIEIDPGDEDIVYFESGGSLYKTLDGGASWATLGSAAWNAVGHEIKDIVCAPGDGSVVFLCADDCLYRSTDSGASFNCVESGRWLELEFHPNNNDIVYALKQPGDRTEFWKSTDAGATFSMIGNGWPIPAAGDEQKRTEIAVSADEPDAVFALATGAANGGSGLYGVYKSTDQGANWTRNCCGPEVAGVPSASNMNLMGWSDEGTDDGGQYYYDLAFDVDPQDADHMLVGGVNLWVSHDGGNTFTCPAKWSHSEKPNYIHADIHDIRFYGSDIWIASDGGGFYSTDGGANYLVRMNGIQATDFWGFGAGFQDGDVMLGGTYHNGTLLQDGNTYLNGWLSTAGGDNIRGFTNFGDRNTCYHDQGTVTLSGDRTVDLQVTSFPQLPNASYIIGESSDMRFHPRCHNIVWTGVDTELWKTDNSGAGASLVYDFGEKVTSIEVGWDNVDIMYVCTWGSFWGADKKIWRSADAGASWTEITPPLAGNWYPWDIVVSSTNDNELWALRVRHTTGDPATNGEMVYYTNDGGSNWTNVSGSAMDGEFPSNIVHQRGTDGGVYVGTRRAVYYKNNTMADWALFNNDLPVSTFSTQLVPYYGGEKIRNGSNRSAYECDFYEQSQPQARMAVDRFSITCLNSTVQYVDHSAMSINGASWSWQFPGGTPASSNDRNPLVTYDAPGTYDATLTITDANGTDSHTVTAIVAFLDQTSAAPAGEDFDSASVLPATWTNTSSSGGAVWQSTFLTFGADCSSSNAMWVDHFSIDNVGAEYYLTSNPYDLSGLSNPSLSYDYSYVRYGNGYEDGFRVEASTDCGANWTVLYDAFGVDLATGADNGDPHVPDCDNWQNVNLDLSAFTGESLTLRFVAVNGWGNNFYLDNISLDGALAQDVVVQAKVWLEGAMEPSLAQMTEQLVDSGLLPLINPYNIAPWDFALATSMTNIPPDAVDWVLVEAREASDFTQVRSSAVCLLKTDGTLMHTDGSAGVVLPDLDPDSDYYLVIRHRNHMDIITANPVSVNNTILHDLTKANNVMMGTSTLKEISAGQYAMLAGDFTAEGVFTYGDYNAYLLQSSNILQYEQNDCNLDGHTTVEDFNLYKANYDRLAVSSLQY